MSGFFSNGKAFLVAYTWLFNVNVNVINRIYYTQRTQERPQSQQS